MLGRLCNGCLVLLVLFCSSVSSARADAARHLVFDYNETGVPPYVIRGPEGVSGITYDILSEALRGMGWKLRMTFHPELRGQKFLDEDRVDCRGKAQEWVKNADRYYWTEPFLSPSNSLVTRSDSPPLDPSPESLRGRSIAGILGFNYPGLAEAFGKGEIRRVDKKTLHECLLLVLKKRADGALVDYSTALWLFSEASEYGPEDFNIARIPGESFDYRLMFNKNRDWRPFIKLFNERIRVMREDGTIDRIMAKYQ